MMRFALFWCKPNLPPQEWKTFAQLCDCHHPVPCFFQGYFARHRGKHLKCSTKFHERCFVLWEFVEKKRSIPFRRAVQMYLDGLLGIRDVIPMPVSLPALRHNL